MESGIKIIKLPSNKGVFKFFLFEIAHASHAFSSKLKKNEKFNFHKFSSSLLIFLGC